MLNRVRFAVVVICILSVRMATAQLWDRMTTPQIPVLIQHAPVVKVSIEHVAFTKPDGGACADSLADALVADFTDSGATVVDRTHWSAVVAEHKLNVNSAHIDSKTAAKIGKLVGSQTLLFVKVHDCSVKRSETAQDYKDKEGNIHRIIRNKLNGTLRASVQATNLTTGVTLAARMVNITVNLPRDTDTNASFGARLLSATASALTSGGTDQLPADDVVLASMQNDAVAQVHKLFFPWTETRKLHFYDDKECGLNTAFRLLRGGDNEGAALEAQTSLETCKSKAALKPAVLAHAYYNVGMTQFILENHDAALEALGQAVRLDGATIITDAMSVCRRAKVLAKEMQELQEQSSSAEKTANTNTTPSAGSKGSPEERLQKLTELHKKGILTDEEYKSKRAEILKDM